ncbi:hypothetical protein [Streptomyces sp. DK15]|uniref:hypothetical protein n=1 Tax=Streptomyces sp. DK15 TaxID=2957499 RepID=UPI0034DEF71B
MKEQCADDGGYVFIGTVGENRPLESLYARVPNIEKIEGVAHVQNRGWDGQWTSGNYIWLGTEGAALNLEALSMRPW